MFHMATITVNVSDDVEKKFRMRAAQLYGKKKGSLGRALTEAMDMWTKKECLERSMTLLKQGLNTGKILYKKREELYDRI